MPDHYQVLGVERTAAPEQIKQSYRRLAIKYHPDKNPGDREAETRFKEVTAAYKTLSDEMSRAAYDRTLKPLSESLRQWVANVTKPRKAEYTQSAVITLEEAILGCTRTTRVGFRLAEFDVPPGTMTGTRLRGTAKDFVVFVNVEVAPHSKYTLDGRDVLVTAEAPYPFFVVGGTVAVQTPRGLKEVHLEPLSRSGVKKKFVGEGCTTSDGTRKGDLVVVVEVEVRKHSPEQLRRLEEYAGSLQLPKPKKRRQRF